jgi:3-hydroxy-9,10-secoandrosta-1,3,5(10)-triene-9,17-dione monooxygenase
MLQLKNSDFVGDEFETRAKSLAPTLATRAREAEAGRRVGDKTIAQLKEAGLFKLLQPKRVGGYEVSLAEFSAAVAEVGKGCGSTAWVVSVTNAHHWIMGLFPEAVQDEVFAQPDTLVAAVPTPRGRAERVEGGYRLSGFWPFCSGSPHANWIGLGAKITDEGSTDIQGAGVFLVPASEIEIKDDWNVSGLRASGSNSIVAKSLFVPAHRYLDLDGALAGERPNLGKNSGTLYRAPFAATLALTLTSPALGMAAGALDYFVTTLPGRKLAYTDEPQIQHAVTHAKIGESAMKIATARLLASEHARLLQQAVEGAELDFQTRARIRMIAGQTVRLCLEATELIFLIAGGSSISDGNPLQRASRDLHAVSSHGHVSFDTNTEMYGRVLLDLPVTVPLI